MSRPEPPPSAWQGAPCPVCAQSLAQRGSAVRASEALFVVLLVCPSGHCWEESICARTHHSSVLVHRRADLEPPRGAGERSAPPP